VSGGTDENLPEFSWEELSKTMKKLMMPGFLAEM
jgi:hypothetical protein